MNQEDILQAYHNRFACKRFDTSRSIPEAELDFLLEIARLSPSSIGAEPWQFLVVRDDILRNRLKPACWNQSQITDASELIVILSKNENHLVNEGYLDRLEADKKISAYAKNFALNQPSISEWTKKQCYIALGNIMSSASMIGIDSCPIEGFDSADTIAEILGVDRRYYDVAVMVALGYRDMPVTPKRRLARDEVVRILE